MQSLQQKNRLAKHSLAKKNVPSYVLFVGPSEIIAIQKFKIRARGNRVVY